MEANNRDRNQSPLLILCSTWTVAYDTHEAVSSCRPTPAVPGRRTNYKVMFFTVRHFAIRGGKAAIK